MGYSEVSITTNGRMLAVDSVARDLIAAGLNRLSFSLHSHSAALHDALSGVVGAHAQLLRGVASCRGVAAQSGAELVLHSITLLLPDNADQVSEVVRLAASLGATIHVVQPFIASRANIHLASRFFVPYDRIVEATTAACREAVLHGTKVKPYNIPPCLLTSLDGIELQDYGLSTRKRHDSGPESGATRRQAQFFRVEACPTCPTPCPGFRVEHTPRGEMVDEIVAAAGEAHGRRLVVPGLDLLPRLHLQDLLQRLAATGREVWPMTGANAWCSHEDFASAVSAAKISTVVHLLRTRCDGERGAEMEPGNEREILELASILAGQGVKNVLFLAVPDLAAFPYSVEAIAGKFQEIAVAVPSTWRGAENGDAFDRLLSTVGLASLQHAEALARVLPVSLVTMDGMRVLRSAAASWQKAFATRFPTDDWSGALLRHRYAGGGEYNFLLWSNPFWVL